MIHIIVGIGFMAVGGHILWKGEQERKTLSQNNVEKESKIVDKEKKESQNPVTPSK